MSKLQLNYNKILLDWELQIRLLGQKRFRMQMPHSGQICLQLPAETAACSMP